LVFGSKEFLHYLVRLVYPDQYRIKDTGETTLNRLVSVEKSLNPDLVLAEFHWIFTKAISKDFLILPDLTWNLDITPTLDVLVSKMKRIRRRCIREIQQKAYSYEFTNDVGKLSFFYTRMYAPYILKAHGDSAKLVSEKLSEDILKKGRLLLVKSENAYVSGILFSRTDAAISCALLGINSEIGQEIDGQAALYGLIKWAKQEGYAEIDYGETPPFVSDGLFEYKRTWGMGVKSLSEKAFGIRACTFSEATLDFLASNPLVFACCDNLAMLLLLDLGDVDPGSLRRRYYTPGLTRLFVIHPTGKTRIETTSPTDNFEDRARARLFAALPLLRKLLKMNYCAQVLTFEESKADEVSPPLQANQEPCLLRHKVSIACP
jgi:hypothetical protein